MKEQHLSAEDWYSIHEIIIKTEKCDAETLPKVLLKELKPLVPFSHSHCFFISSKDDDAETRESYKFYSPDIPRQHMIDYVEKYMDIDFINWFSENSELNAYRESDVISPKVRCNTKFFKEWLEPVNLYYGAVMMLRKDDTEYMEFYLYRSQEEGDFSDKELEILGYISYYMSDRLFRQFPNGIEFEAIYKNASMPKSKLDSLTFREREILELIVNGTLRKDLASTLFISESTLNKHFANIYSKLACHSYEELLMMISKPRSSN